MTNMEIAWVFEEIADLIELAGDNNFKSLAYRKAARALQHLNLEAADLLEDGQLTRIPGIGKNLAEKIAELVRTNRCSYLEDLREQVPAGLREMLAIPGLGPRSVSVIYKGLGIKTLNELEKAAAERRIRNLPGMGNKTELNILRGVDMLKNQKGTVILGVAVPIAERMLTDLRSIPEVTRVEAAGEVRRGQEVISSLQLLVLTARPDLVIEVFTKHPLIKELVQQNDEVAVVTTWTGLTVELHLVERENFFLKWLALTGSPEHLQLLEEKARSHDHGLTGNRLHRSDGKPEPVASEEDIYHRLGMGFVPPELRENRGEVEAALSGKLPGLLEIGDIRGDLHMHTRWSDGVDTIADMVTAAQKRGYEYLAITDHSRSLVIAKGLSLERLQSQKDEITKLNEELDGSIRLLRGTEVDILADGKLDFPDEILAEMDLVIASIHSGFRMDGERMNARVEAALKNPHVDILAHPTGRILGRRKSYELDLERVMELAAETGTWLEINASPDRLDLNDVHARKAKEMGIPIAINTDAHDVSRLDEMKYGVLTARRGWLEKSGVVNAWPLAEVMQRKK